MPKNKTYPTSTDGTCEEEKLDRPESLSGGATYATYALQYYVAIHSKAISLRKTQEQL